MLGMRGGDTRNVPAHHGVDLGRVMTKAEKLAMNPAKAAREAAKADQRENWTPPVLRSVAVKSEGTAEVMAALDRHAQYLIEAGVLAERGGSGSRSDGRRNRRKNFASPAME